LPNREGRLRSALERITSEYDFVLIDCPPSLSLLTVNAFAAADEVLIPMQCEYYALEGLSDLVGTIKRVRAHINPRLEIAGLLRTMYDPRNTLSHQVSQQLEEHFGEKVYRTLVPRNVRLAEAPSFGAPAVIWDRASKGAQAYLALADEVLARAGVLGGGAT
jgi:chromosome partitioning protein